jgi:phosphatidylglycerol:prolipoprotein diacylglycerol transferase
VSGPQIPYIKVPEIPLPFADALPSAMQTIKPFGLLVATGVYVGAWVAMRRGKQRGLDEAKLNSFIVWVVGLGFVGAHVFDAIFYTPERIARDPLYLFKLWAGLSSYGGFLGAILGALAFKYVKREKVLPYVDVVCSAFPLAWVFGRAGCATVHDHPGSESNVWWAVQYFHPDVRNPDAWGLLYDAAQTRGRFDLGLYEMLLTVPLATAFHFLWSSKPRAFGFYAGWMSILYAPVRFVLDFMRIEPGGGHEADPRYAGLTPAQWACFGLLGLGVFLLKLSKQHPAPASWADVRPLEVQSGVSMDGDDDDDAAEPAPAKPKRARRTKRAAAPAGASARPSADAEAEAAERGDADRDPSDADDAPAKPATDGAADAPPASETSRSGS